MYKFNFQIATYSQLLWEEINKEEGVELYNGLVEFAYSVLGRELWAKIPYEFFRQVYVHRILFFNRCCGHLCNRLHKTALAEVGRASLRCINSSAGWLHLRGCLLNQFVFSLCSSYMLRNPISCSYYDCLVSLSVFCRSFSK